ncbi:MAG: DNA polymerase III subunit beta [Clostridiales bacterium]|nr:DNA polymerase III subunit beta [Clostridiales bacterium]
MKLKCNQKELSHAINIVQKAISSRSTLPILTGILLEANEGCLTLTGNDLSIGIKKSVKAEIINHGSTVVSSNIFGDFVRKLPNQEITIELDGNNLSIVCLESKIDLITFNPVEYPELPIVENSSYYSVNSALMGSMIHQTIFAISNDETRPILTGALMNVSDNKLTIVAIDGFRVAIRHGSVSSHIESKVIVPGKTLSEVNKIIGSYDESEMLDIYVTENHILFKIGGIEIVSRLLNGEYLKYNQMIPSNFTTTLNINTKDFLHAIDRASLIAKIGKNDAIRLSVTNNKLLINSLAEIGHANEKISIDVTGKLLDIGFNPRYLVEALKVIDSEFITMKLLSETSPTIIEPLDNDNYTYLAVPVRIPKT